MIHGLFGHLHFAELLGAFHGLKTSAPDLIGYGKHKGADTRGLTLADQADHVIAHIEQHLDTPVHLLGHSVGGAVSALVAIKRADLVQSLTSVEGNFTLKDAFWSAQIAQKSPEDVADIVDGYRADPDAWIGGAIAHPTALSARLAREWLDHQLASTLQAQARAVVKATGHEGYLQELRRIMTSDMPVHLIGGARSADGWDVPAWANDLCTSRIDIPDTGHLMMVENPDAFARAVLDGLRLNGVIAT